MTEVPFGAGRARFFAPPKELGARVPLVVLLHGLGSSGTALAGELRLEERAARDGFMYVAPDGTVDRAGRRFWNAGPRCCDFFDTRTDDVQRLVGLIDYAIRDLGADEKRVFVIGYSNGGFMAHRVACERSGRVAAIVSIAGAGPDSDCNPSDPVAVLEIHGDKDTIVPASGGHLFGRAELPSVSKLELGLATWQKRNQCAGALTTAEKVDLVDDVSGRETEVLRPTSCQEAPVEFWNVRGGSHTLALGPSAIDAIWSFLRPRSR